LLPALRPGELPLFLRRYRPVWILADPDRMPDRDEDDDFSGMARSHWSERDWTTHSLDHVPYLKDESPVVADSRAHLYRVLSTPAEPAHPGTQTPAPLSHP